MDECLCLEKSIKNSILDILQNRASLQNSGLPFSFGIPDLTTKYLIDPFTRKEVEKVISNSIKKYERRVFDVSIEFIDIAQKNKPILSIRGQFNYADKVNEINFNVEI